MAIEIGHGTAADGTFSATGAAAWNAAHSLSGLTANALLYSTDATTLAQDGTNLLYTTASGPRLQVGSTGTSVGWIAGYSGASGYSGLWLSSQTPSSSNGILISNSGDTYLQGSSTINFRNLASQAKMVLDLQTAGAGLSITAGTATADVAALSVTRTNNNAAVATGVKFAFTDTTSAAGFLPFQVLGGASASTNLLSLSKNGVLAFPAPADATQANANIQIGSGGTQVALGIGFNHSFYVYSQSQQSLLLTAAKLALNSGQALTWSGGANDGSVAAQISPAGANAVRFAGTTLLTTETARTEINKAVTAFTDGAAKTVFTLTIPNAAHSASYLVRVTGSIGAGGAIGANEASATNCYVVTLTRTAGVNATAAISSAFGAAATNVAGATTVTCTAALAAVSGGVGASNTIDIQATITKGGGSSDNHTCVATASLLNANSSGVTIA